MTNEEKQLLLKDLSARFPYGVICTVWFKDSEGWKNEDMKLSGLFNDSSQQFFTSTNGSAYSDEFIPYLRPMSNLIEKELDECRATCKYRQVGQSVLDCATPETIDYLISHHFDYRGLIPMGLALKAPKDMYKNE